jgi:hypothetical protein
MTRYWAATALYQEVQLLNRYVRDAAVRDGCQAFVVRMQVSLMPAARGEPYDAYCTLGFFEGDREGAPTTSLRDPSGAPLRTTPQVIPLMVTDNLEAGMQARAMDSVRQLAGAVYAMSFSVGASADVQNLQETLQRVFGQDLNSLLTVGRVTDNTIRVRLGAQQQASSDFAMVPRSHNVTLLLLVPEGSGPSIDVIMRSTMVDTITGEALPPRSELEIQGLLAEVARAHGLGGEEPALLEELLADAQRNDRVGFEAELAAVLGDERAARERAPELWLDLVATMAGSRYAATQFDLPRIEPGLRGDLPELPPTQTALFEDDGLACSATLSSGGIGGRVAIAATLLVPADGREMRIPADLCEVDELEHRLHLRFPSLVSWGLAPRESVKRLKLRLECDGRRLDLDALHRFASAAAELNASASGSK